MEICDRCFPSGDTTKATNSVTFARTDETFDLCQSCAEAVREFIESGKPHTEEKPKRGRKRTGTTSGDPEA